jgi:hypothetical protein
MMIRFPRILYAAAVAVWIFTVINLTAEPAHAYVDPGSGLLALQIIGSTFAGAMFLIRKRVRDLSRFLFKRAGEVNRESEPS